MMNKQIHWREQEAQKQSEGYMMNERMKELAVEAAGLDIDTFTPSHLDTQGKVAKFAHLIVEECAKVADSESSYPYKDFGDKIRAHFGIES